MVTKSEVKRGSKMGLGRGLSALISKPVVSITAAKPVNEPDGEVEQVSSSNLAKKISTTSESIDTNSNDGIRLISTSSIIPNPSQPRKVFIEQELVELADSIKNLGVLQPLIVRPSRADDHDKYEIVAGERRWRASQKAGISQVPVIIKELSDWESLEIALVENVQRSQLNPIDEAESYQRLMDQYSLTQQDVADRIGKDRASVSNYIRLLKLAPEVVKMIRDSKLSVGHAKVILAVKEPTAQISLAKKTSEEGISVRALEGLVAHALVLDGQRQPAQLGKHFQKGSNVGASLNQYPELVERLRKSLGTKVRLKAHKSGRGRIEIDYFSEAELDRLIAILCD